MHWYINFLDIPNIAYVEGAYRMLLLEAQLPFLNLMAEYFRALRMFTSLRHLVLNQVLITQEKLDELAQALLSLPSCSVTMNNCLVKAEYYPVQPVCLRISELVMDSMTGELTHLRYPDHVETAAFIATCIDPSALHVLSLAGLDHLSCVAFLRNAAPGHELAHLRKLTLPSAATVLYAITVDIFSRYPAVRQLQLHRYNTVYGEDIAPSASFSLPQLAFPALEVFMGPADLAPIFAKGRPLVAAAVYAPSIPSENGGITLNTVGVPSMLHALRQECPGLDELRILGGPESPQAVALDQSMMGLALDAVSEFTDLTLLDMDISGWIPLQVCMQWMYTVYVF
jgi:hypothetical protein